MKDLGRNKMIRIYLMLLVGLFAVSGYAKKPNVVYILADDQGWGDVGYHDPTIYTPNLDTLSGEGIRLEHYYVHPQCTPTRVALLTGRYPHRFGPQASTAGSNEQAIPYGTPTLASLLKSAGYETALIGKWHLGSVRSQGPYFWGFDYSYGCLAGGCDNYTHLYKYSKNNPYSHTWHRNGVLFPDSEKGERYEEGRHTTDLITEDAIKFIRRKHEKPFFLYLAHTAPHTPHQEEEKWYSDPEGKLAKLDKKRQTFAAVLHHLDSAVGQVADVLKETGQWENTIVIYSSDNGGMPSAGASNANLKSSKKHVYEGGVRVPAWVSWPAQLKQGVINEPMHVTDWVPTLCGIAGVKSLPEQLDGIDILPLLQGKTAPQCHNRNFYWAWGSSAPFVRQAVRMDHWKLVNEKASKKNTPWELYNVLNDPSEATDLADQHPEKVVSMLDYLKTAATQDVLEDLPSIWIDAPETASAGEPVLCMIHCTIELDLPPSAIVIKGAETVRFIKAQKPKKRLKGVACSYELELKPLGKQISISVQGAVAKTNAGIPNQACKPVICEVK